MQVSEKNKEDETGHRNGEMVREICIFAEQHDREQERQG